MLVLWGGLYHNINQSVAFGIAKVLGKAQGVGEQPFITTAIDEVINNYSHFREAIQKETIYHHIIIQL